MENDHEDLKDILKRLDEFEAMDAIAQKEDWAQEEKYQQAFMELARLREKIRSGVIDMFTSRGGENVCH